MENVVLIIHLLLALALIAVVLMQRSEGGGLGVGGSSSGLMTARGQADFLTRATAFAAVAFVGLSILLAGLATQQRAEQAIDTSLTQPVESTETAPPVIGDAPASEPVDNDILGTIAGQSEADGTDEGAAE